MSGEPATYLKTTAESGNPRLQAFCPRCGSPIYSTTPGEGPQPSYMVRVGILRQRQQAHEPDVHPLLLQPGGDRDPDNPERDPGGEGEQRDREQAPASGNGTEAPPGAERAWRLRGRRTSAGVCGNHAGFT